MEILFFISIVGYFAAMFLQTVGAMMGKEALTRPARAVFAASFILHTAFTVWRGIAAQRVPLANQFEFASGFAWSAAVMGLVLYARLRQNWVMTASMPVAFLVLSYAAFQPMEIKELMPALRSTWFALHIGSATFSYASFAIAGGLGVRYLWLMKKGHAE
ncbi:MAG: cytochrome c biogenesis protein CcsA, partial [Clostridia bacterium]|nr:cytochrome c biogenesis protein CcsA [Clostridia bacterium]